MLEEEGTQPGLVARDLALWRGDLCLFSRLSLTAAPGELLHVTGPNGIGKTSLLRVLCGLSRPEEGEVSWNGNVIDRQALQLHRDLAWTGHRDGLKNDLSVIENLKFSIGLRRSDEQATIEPVLARAGLAEQAELPVRALSAGQRKRVAMARVLCSAARLWILDEPFSNLDAEGAAWGFAELGAHVAAGGTALITSHHGLDVAGARIRRLELGA